MCVFLVFEMFLNGFEGEKKMVDAKNKWWLVENNNAMKATRSSWLQSTLSGN